MKRMAFGVVAAVVLFAGANDGVVAGSKWKPWKKSGGTCAAPMGCYGPATCYDPVCSQPLCDQPYCGAPTCFASGCGMPSCAAPWFGAPMGCAGCGGCGGCSGMAWGDATIAGPGWGPSFGPNVGGLPMTPPYHAPVAPMTFSVPAIPAAEDLAW